MQDEHLVMAAVDVGGGIGELLPVGSYPDREKADAAAIGFATRDADRKVAWEAVRAAVRSHETLRPKATVVRNVPWGGDKAAKAEWMLTHAGACRSERDALLAFEGERRAIVTRTLATFGLDVSAFALDGVVGATAYVVRKAEMEA